MKKVIITSILISLFQLVTMYGQQTGELTLTSNFKVSNELRLDLELEGEISTEYWNKEYVKIEIQIKSDVEKLSVLRCLKSQGRFKVEYTPQRFASILVSMPNLYKTITVNNRKYTEQMTFKVYVPKGILINDLYAVDDLLGRAE